jgi:hypothetical protein
VKAYEYGQDLKPLLVIERAAYRSVADPAQRQAMAQQLLGILSDSKATPAGRQFTRHTPTPRDLRRFAPRLKAGVGPQKRRPDP